MILMLWFHPLVWFPYYLLILVGRVGNLLIWVSDRYLIVRLLYRMLERNLVDIRFLHCVQDRSLIVVIVLDGMLEHNLILISMVQCSHLLLMLLVAQ